MLSHLYWVTHCSCTLWITADGAEASLESHGLESVWGKCEDRAVKDAMDAVGFQSVFLDFVVITTVPLMAGNEVLEAVDVCYVRPSSWFELVKLVCSPRQGLE